MLFIVLPWPSYRRCSWYVPDSAIAIVLEVVLGGGVLLSAPRSRGLARGGAPVPPILREPLAGSRFCRTALVPPGPVFMPTVCIENGFSRAIFSAEGMDPNNMLMFAVLGMLPLSLMLADLTTLGLDHVRSHRHQRSHPGLGFAGF